jgi:hypothetical protein
MDLSKCQGTVFATVWSSFVNYSREVPGSNAAQCFYVYPSCVWNYTKRRGTQNFQNSGRQEGDMKQVPYWGTTNISRYRANVVAMATGILGLVHSLDTGELPVTQPLSALQLVQEQTAM